MVTRFHMCGICLTCRNVHPMKCACIVYFILVKARERLADFCGVHMETWYYFGRCRLGCWESCQLLLPKDSLMSGFTSFRLELHSNIILMHSRLRLYIFSFRNFWFDMICWFGDQTSRITACWWGHRWRWREVLWDGVEKLRCWKKMWCVGWYCHLEWGIGSPEKVVVLVSPLKSYLELLELPTLVCFRPQTIAENLPIL